MSDVTITVKDLTSNETMELLRSMSRNTLTTVRRRDISDAFAPRYDVTMADLELVRAWNLLADLHNYACNVEADVAPFAGQGKAEKSE